MGRQQTTDWMIVKSLALSGSGHIKLSHCAGDDSHRCLPAAVNKVGEQESRVQSFVYVCEAINHIPYIEKSEGEPTSRTRT